MHSQRSFGGGRLGLAGAQRMRAYAIQHTLQTCMLLPLWWPGRAGTGWARRRGGQRQAVHMARPTSTASHCTMGFTSLHPCLNTCSQGPVRPSLCTSTLQGSMTPGPGLAQGIIVCQAATNLCTRARARAPSAACRMAGKAALPASPGRIQYHHRTGIRPAPPTIPPLALPRTHTHTHVHHPAQSAAQHTASPLAITPWRGYPAGRAPTHAHSAVG